jgi:hypothetical protein
LQNGWRPLRISYRGLVLAAPRIREGGSVERDAERGQRRLRLARDAGAPIDQGAEDVEE